MAVARCVCFNVAFKQIREHVLQEQGTLVSAHERTGFGGRCGLCIPYVLRSLQAGRDELPVMWSEDFQRCGIPPGAIEQLEKRVKSPDRVLDGAAAAETAPTPND